MVFGRGFARPSALPANKPAGLGGRGRPTVWDKTALPDLRQSFVATNNVASASYSGSSRAAERLVSRGADLRSNLEVTVSRSRSQSSFRQTSDTRQPTRAERRRSRSTSKSVSEPRRRNAMKAEIELKVPTIIRRVCNDRFKPNGSLPRNPSPLRVSTGSKQRQRSRTVAIRSPSRRERSPTRKRSKSADKRAPTKKRSRSACKRSPTRKRSRSKRKTSPEEGYLQSKKARESAASRLSSGVRSSLSKQRDLEPAPPGGISIDDALNNVEERMRKLVEEEGEESSIRELRADLINDIRQDEQRLMVDKMRRREEEEQQRRRQDEQRLMVDKMRRREEEEQQRRRQDEQRLMEDKMRRQEEKEQQRQREEEQRRRRGQEEQRRREEEQHRWQKEEQHCRRQEEEEQRRLEEDDQRRLDEEAAILERQRYIEELEDETHRIEELEAASASEQRHILIVDHEDTRINHSPDDEVRKVEEVTKKLKVEVGRRKRLQKQMEDKYREKSSLNDAPQQSGIIKVKDFASIKNASFGSADVASYNDKGSARKEDFNSSLNIVRNFESRTEDRRIMIDGPPEITSEGNRHRDYARRTDDDLDHVGYDRRTDDFLGRFGSDRGLSNDEFDQQQPRDNYGRRTEDVNDRRRTEFVYDQRSDDDEYAQNGSNQRHGYDYDRPHGGVDDDNRVPRSKNYWSSCSSNSDKDDDILMIGSKPGIGYENRKFLEASNHHVADSKTEADSRPGFQSATRREMHREQSSSHEDQPRSSGQGRSRSREKRQESFRRRNDIRQSSRSISQQRRQGSRGISKSHERQQASRERRSRSRERRQNSRERQGRQISRGHSKSREKRQGRRERQSRSHDGRKKSGGNRSPGGENRSKSQKRQSPSRDRRSTSKERRPDSRREESLSGDVQDDDFLGCGLYGAPSGKSLKAFYCDYLRAMRKPLLACEAMMRSWELTSAGDEAGLKRLVLKDRHTSANSLRHYLLTLLDSIPGGRIPISVDRHILLDLTVRFFTTEYPVLPCTGPEVHRSMSGDQASKQTDDLLQPLVLPQPVSIRGTEAEEEMPVFGKALPNVDPTDPPLFGKTFPNPHGLLTRQAAACEGHSTTKAGIGNLPPPRQASLANVNGNLPKPVFNRPVSPPPAHGMAGIVRLPPPTLVNNPQRWSGLRGGGSGGNGEGNLPAPKMAPMLAQMPSEFQQSYHQAFQQQQQQKVFLQQQLQQQQQAQQQAQQLQLQQLQQLQQQLYCLPVTTTAAAATTFPISYPQTASSLPAHASVIFRAANGGKEDTDFPSRFWSLQPLNGFFEKKFGVQFGNDAEYIACLAKGGQELIARAGYDMTALRQLWAAYGKATVINNLLAELIKFEVCFPVGLSCQSLALNTADFLEETTQAQ